MDFYELANENVRSLTNNNERKLFEFTMRHASEARDLSIRDFAKRNYVSTTTVLRFVRKLGFDGYREFKDSLCRALDAEDHIEAQVPSILWKKNYSEEYLYNVIETVRVIPAGQIEKLVGAIGRCGMVVCAGVGMDYEVARYAYHTLVILGCPAVCPKDGYELEAVARRFTDNDVALLFSQTGEDQEIISFAEQLQHAPNATVATFTQSGNNSLLFLGTLDFYVFAENIVIRDENISSRVPMMALVDLITYALMGSEKNTGRSTAESE